MPNMDGFALIKNLYEIKSDTIIIAGSGLLMPENNFDNEALNINPYTTKKFFKHIDEALLS